MDDQDSIGGGLQLDWRPPTPRSTLIPRSAPASPALDWGLLPPGALSGVPSSTCGPQSVRARSEMESHSSSLLRKGWSTGASRLTVEVAQQFW